MREGNAGLLSLAPCQQPLRTIKTTHVSKASSGRTCGSLLCRRRGSFGDVSNIAPGPLGYPILSVQYYQCKHISLDKCRLPYFTNNTGNNRSPESSIKYSIHKKTLRERCCYPSIPIPPTHLPYPFPHNGASLPPTPTDKHVQYKQLRRPASQPGIPFVRPCACKNKPPGFLPLSALRHPA